jgi:hypothetical protein
MNTSVKRSSKRKDNKPAARAQQAVYHPTAREQEALNSQIQRSEAEVPMPLLKFETTGKVLDLHIHLNDDVVARSLLRETLGSRSDAFVDGLFLQLESARSPHDYDLNFAVSVIKSIKPNDQLETMLTAQMAVTHMATMRFASRLSRADNRGAV